MALIEKLAAIANAIRSKTGKTDGLTLEQMPGEIAGIETGGVSEQEIIDSLIARTFPSGAVTFNSTNISGNWDAVKNNNAITSANFPNITQLGAYVLDGCSNVESVNAPNLTSTGAGCFKKTGLKTVNFPKLNGAGMWFCNECKNLTNVKLPLVTGFSNGAFEYCHSLKVVDILGGGSFSSGATFQNDYAFDTLIMRNETTITALSYTFANNTTPFAGYNGLVGYCYVPSALISEYQQATNWSALYEAGTCIFRALEDYTIDGTTTGEMDWAKIEGGTA